MTILYKHETSMIIEVNVIYVLITKSQGSTTWSDLTGKTMASPISRCLAWETNNIATYIVKDRYTAFLRMVQQWRHLVMLKRAGCSHNPLGVSATSQGGCTVVCPACPQPGKNLPANWKSAPKDERYELLGIYFHDSTFQ